MFLRVTVPTAHFAGNRRAGIKPDFKHGSLGFRTHACGMQSSGLSDARDDDGDLSITSLRDNFVIDFACDLPVAWTVSAQGGCIEPVDVRAGTLLDVLQMIGPCHSHMILHASSSMLLFCQVSKTACAVMRMLHPDVNLMFAGGYLCNRNAAVDELITLARMFNLRSLSIDRITEEDWTPAGVAKLAQVVQGAHQLQKLKICTQNLGDKTLFALLPAITQNTALKHLDLACNRIDDDGLFYLIPSLAMSGGIESLNLSGNDVGDDAGLFLSKGLQRYMRLRHLRLSCCKLGAGGVEHIVSVLPACEALVELTLGDVGMGASGASAVWKFARDCSTLQMLDLAQNQIRDAGCKNAAHRLRCCTSLVDIDISSNWIDVDGMEILAREFQRLPKLKRLNLAYNHIAGMATTLFDALQHCSLLEILVLDGCSISNEGATALARMLPHTGHLRGLYVSSNGISDRGVSSFAEMLPHCVALEQFDLADNSIGDAGFQAIVSALPQCTTLRALDLQTNEFRTAPAKEAMFALQPTCPELRCYFFQHYSDSEASD